MNTGLFWPFGRLFKQDSEKPSIRVSDRFRVNNNITTCLCLLAALGWAQQVAAVEVYVPEPKLTVDDGWIIDSFGADIALDGNRLAVGATGTDDFGVSSGSVYVFEYDGTQWVETARLLASDGAPVDNFGRAISLDGDRMAVGSNNGLAPASGSVYVFDYDGANWIQTAKLLASDGAQADDFGTSVSLVGDRLVAGAPSTDDFGTNSGAAYIFDYDGANWTQTIKFLASDGRGGDNFGIAVSMDDDGKEVVVGARRARGTLGTNSGAAYVFRLYSEPANWGQDYKLYSTDGSDGDLFGAAVSMSGNRVVVGAPEDDHNNTDRGSVYVFEEVGPDWVQTIKLLAQDGKPNDFFGGDVSLSGNRLLVGAQGGFGTYTGSAYVFDYNGAGWVQIAKLRAADGDPSFTYFGRNVSLSGDQVVVGAIGGGYSANGSAHVFNARDIVEPLVDLKVNGIEGPVTVDASEATTLSHQVWTGEVTGIVDWWLFADAPDGTTWSWLSETSTWVPYISPAHPQSEIQDVLNQSFNGDTLNLPPGNYLIRGGLDLTPNDVLDEPMYMDSLEINITNSLD